MSEQDEHFNFASLPHDLDLYLVRREPTASVSRKSHANRSTDQFDYTGTFAEETQQSGGDSNQPNYYVDVDSDQSSESSDSESDSESDNQPSSHTSGKANFISTRNQSFPAERKES